MSQNEQGVLYPFRLSGSRMRRSAAELRRHGQVVDALILVRRAAEQEDTPSAWFALAQELRLTGNWEAAAQLLARVISREPEHPAAWLEMARCFRAMEMTEPALDCAYHQLRIAIPYGDVETIREFIAQLQPPDREHPICREQRLKQRIMTAWRSGDRRLGERRLRRLMRITKDKERLLTSAAMLCMLDMDLEGAQKYLIRVLRINPQSTRVLTALSTLYFQKGKRRLARGFLQKAGKHVETVIEEDSFLTAAWAQDAWGEMNDFLTARRKLLPYRAALQSAEAGMLMEIGMTRTAQELWRDVVAINPEDRYATAMLTASLTETERVFHVPGILPRRIRRQQLEKLQDAAAQGEALLQIGSGNRRLLDWLLSSGEEEERQYAMQLLAGCEDEAVTAFLRELLCRPFLREETREWALVHLAERGCSDPVPLLLGTGYSIIRCRKPEEPMSRRPWRDFLSTLLNVTRRHHRSNEIVDYAAQLWRKLPGAMRLRAGRRAYTWAVAVEVLFLLEAGEPDTAIRALKDSYAPYRVGRVIRRINRCRYQENAQPMLENGDT